MCSDDQRGHQGRDAELICASAGGACRSFVVRVLLHANTHRRSECFAWDPPGLLPSPSLTPRAAAASAGATASYNLRPV